MVVGDCVRLKPGSDLSELLGPAAEAIGTVSHVSGDLIWIDYPEVPAYLQAVEVGEFDVVAGEAATAR